MKKHFKLAFTALSGVGLLSLGMPNARAVDGTFVAGSSWGTGSNWSSGTIPNVIGAVATFDSATGPLSTGNLTVSMGASTKTVGTINIVNNSANSLTFNTNSGTSAITFDVASGNATLSVAGSGAQTTSIAAPVILNDTLQIDVTNTAASTALAFAVGNISGAGGIIKTGAGVLNLGTGQTYTGGTVLQNGVIVSSNTSTYLGGTSFIGTFGTGTLTLQGGTIRALSNASTRTFYNAVNLNGNVTFGVGQITFSASAGNSTVLTGTSSITTSGSSLTWNQNIVGTGSTTRLVKAGASTLTLGGSNSFIGGFTVTEGVLEVGIAATMGGTSGSTVPDYVADFFRLDGGTIRFTQTFNTPLTGNRGFTLGAGGGTIEVAAGVTMRANGRFVQSSAGATLVKTGSGTYILGAGNSNYTGATTVSQGTLLIDSDASISNSAVTVAAGATFGGSGTAGGAVTVNGTLAPGFSGTAGTLTVANSLSLGSSASVTMKLGGNTLGTYDQVTGITNLTLDGTITVSLLGAYDPTAGSSFQLLSWSGLVDATNFNILTDLILPSLDPGLSWDTSNFLTNGTITAVPEPATNALLVCSVGLVVGMRRFFGARKRS